MPSIEQLDPNFAQALQTQPNDQFYDAAQPPFSIHGLLPTRDGQYRRLPDALHLTEPLAHLSRHTAGGRIRFATDAKYCHICVTLGSTGFMSHMPLTGSSGLDIYLDDATHLQTVRPNVTPDGAKSQIYGATIALPGDGIHTVTAYLPLYDSVDKIQIGLPEGTALTAPRAYTIPDPIVFYGSSITQGGCACRTSKCHAALTAFHMDADFINLGFSGNAKGEPEMAHYIATLPMSAFVLDYDHNGPNPEHLAKTHAPFFNIIRKANPTLPILILSSPNIDTLANAQARRAIIYQTYAQALNQGDQNTHFIPGDILLNPHNREACRVDAAHPNDMGFEQMARAITGTLRRFLRGTPSAQSASRAGTARVALHGLGLASPPCAPPKG